MFQLMCFEQAYTATLRASNFLASNDTEPLNEEQKEPHKVPFDV